MLGMDHLPGEVPKPWPVGRIRFVVIVVTAGPDKEVASQVDCFSRSQIANGHLPALGPAVPIDTGDPLVVLDLVVQPVLFDHLFKIIEDRLPACDRFALPWLECIAKGVEVTVRADTGIGVRVPRSPMARFFL